LRRLKIEFFHPHKSSANLQDETGFWLCVHCNEPLQRLFLSCYVIDIKRPVKWFWHGNVIVVRDSSTVIVRYVILCQSNTN